MSQETLSWLNQNVLVGFADKRGKAWHFNAREQGAEPNHYPGAVPVEDVKRRLFHWKPVEGDVTSTVLLPDGVLKVTDPKRKAIVRPDTQTILGIFGKESYTIHDYEQWLVENVENLLDDDLGIGSAGLLRGGGVAWVTVEVPESITTPEGVTFRPLLTAGTSLDGTMASVYRRTVMLPVCDNTLSAALGIKGQGFKVKHSRKSLGKLQDARDALAIVHTTADDFAAEVATLTAEKVSDQDYQRFLDVIAPLVDETGAEKDGRSLTLARNKQDTLRGLWNDDERVTPWKNTSFGVLQAVNTYETWYATVRNMDRMERNQLRAVRGDMDTLDTNTITTLHKVVA